MQPECVVIMRTDEWGWLGLLCLGIGPRISFKIPQAFTFALIVINFWKFRSSLQEHLPIRQTPSGSLVISINNEIASTTGHAGNFAFLPSNFIKKPLWRWVSKIQEFSMNTNFNILSTNKFSIKPHNFLNLAATERLTEEISELDRIRKQTARQQLFADAKFRV